MTAVPDRCTPEVRSDQDLAHCAHRMHERQPQGGRDDPARFSSASTPRCPLNQGTDDRGAARILVCDLIGLRVLLLFLPSMRKKPALAEGSSPEGDLLQEHWLVEDMFIFENVGFTKDVGNIKFLVCADCEIGPIGWHCLDDKNSFYVALERVSHE
ncbi:PREDICTED: guanine nucleotide exchange factor MSS4 [Myotis brandtii]|nr:PREDICTED: guanine nucleotide exchange factor MSS4 [Myotis brandtii]